jgi:putative CRISPR-associated protein (TIGR02619 family)
MLLIISTVGQSVVNNQGERVKSLSRDFVKETHDLKQIAYGDNDFPGREIYDLTLNTLRANINNREFLSASCAEINSLLRIVGDSQPDTNDELHFIASETPDGVLAARIIADFCMYDLLDRDCKIHIIEGLQVENALRFRTVGLRGLIKTIYDLLRDRDIYRRVLNPTGGFKGVVPYLTLIGMLQKTEIQYIYERSEEIISLSHLPILFDYSQFGSNIVETLKATDNDFIAEKDLIQRLQIQEALVDHPAWSLFDVTQQQGENWYNLSGLGRIALEQLNVEPAQKVYLSRQAFERLQDTPQGSEAYNKFRTILNNIHNPTRRQSNMHDYPNGANAQVFKLARSSQRAFYIVEDDTVLVLELAEHRSERDYDVVPQRRKDYGQHTLWQG